MDGRLLIAKDKAQVIAMLVRLCSEHDLEFVGKVGYAYEFVLDTFTTDGPVE